MPSTTRAGSTISFGLPAETKAPAKREYKPRLNKASRCSTRPGHSTRLRECSSKGVRTKHYRCLHGVSKRIGPPALASRFPIYLSILGDAYIQAGRPDDARDALDEGLGIAERSDELWQKAELHRLKGELALRAGSPNGDAEDSFVKRSEQHGTS